MAPATVGLAVTWRVGTALAADGGCGPLGPRICDFRVYMWSGASSVA